MPEEFLAGDARIVEDIGEPPSMAAMRADFAAKMERQIARYLEARQAPPIDGAVGDHFYGVLTSREARAKQKRYIEDQLGGIYGRRANDWIGAVIEFVPKKSGKIKHGRLIKVTNPGTADAQALIGWLLVQDMTHSEVVDMSQEPWPLPDYTARVIRQPALGKN